MGCSNARLLVQAPLTGEAGAGTTNPLSLPSTVATSPVNVATDTNNTTTRMHLTGVDLVVERNGSYTLLLTPKTHKQLMPYVLRKKRFRILVDKPRSDPILTTNEPVMMENNQEIKATTKKEKKLKQNPMQSTVESIEQIASNELDKAQTRVLGGRSIDLGDLEDEDEYIQSDDEGMIEEIVTTIEQDKDLECKVKKKIETKKTTAQHPETHNTITKVVKTEVTEITRTITINDHHDLERAKRELGIDDVNRLLPSSSWMDQSRSTQIKEKRYDPMNEVVTSKDFPSDSPKKQTPLQEKTILAESTMVGRGPVTETIPSSEAKPIEIKKKKKKSKLCSCTRSTADDEQDKQKVITPPPEQPKKASVLSTPVVQSVVDTQIQGEQLISSELKQLIIDKKFLLIEYIHSKVFSPSNLFTSNEQDIKARKISSRILDLLRYDRCSSWTQMHDQLTEEYTGQPLATSVLQPMINTYENLFTKKQANLLNTFSTIHHENDIKDIQQNNDYLNLVQTRINQPNIEVIPKLSLDDTNDTFEQLQQTTQEEQMEPLPKTIQEEQIERSPEIVPEEEVERVPEMAPEEQIEKVINDDDEQTVKELNTPDDTEESLPVYNEEYLIKMLGDISQHKPITLAEAIAYEYIDVEDPKLGLSNETSQCMKNLFRPLSDESQSNLIRIKRSGEYLTDINLSETNSFRKLTETEPLIYQLQQTFEPTLDFNEKQFRSLTETILNNKDQYDQLQFDIARTSLPIYDMKESSTNEFSQSDSGYSMTTATHESLASKIKIEFEPINQDIGPIPPKREDLYEDEKIDLDKATPEQLDKYELNQDLIQIIKSDFNGSDKTIGQAILSRELRLDSTDPSDISHLNSLGIQKEQARILTAFFFPKHTRIIAYSPEPGRFVEAQTTFNPDYPGYKTDTTIIQIQEKQLSSDHLAMQRNIHDDRPSQKIPEPEESTSTVVTTTPSKDKTPPSTPVHVKKRKSDGSGGLLSCFKSKKPKPGTEQQGQPTVLTTQTSVQQQQQQQTTKPIETKPIIDYSILPDGKRIYIDVFRDRPGLDMSYKPNDFENRFVLPVTKPASEYERPITPEIKPRIVEEESAVPVQSESLIHSEVQPPSTIEQKPHIHLEPRPATIEPVDVQLESPSLGVPLTKSEDKAVTKKSVPIDLHGAAVNLPEIELVQPGPLPTLPLTKEKKTTKVKKSTGGLCASCFGAKAAEKKKKEIVSETVPVAPVEQKKPYEEEKRDLSAIIESSPLPSPTTDQPILPKVNIDIFKERNFQKSAEALPKPEDRLDTTIEKTMPIIEPHSQSPASEPAPPIPKNTSIFSKVNIDTFKERTFQKSSESLPKPEERLDATHQTVTPSAPPEEPYYQLPTNEPVPTAKPIESTITKDSSIFSQVNIDTFRERTFQKSSESLPKSEEPHYEFPSSEPVPLESLPLENEYSSPQHDTYDIPRTIELEQTSSPPSIEIKTEEKIHKNEIMIPPTTDVQKSSGDFHPTESIKELPKKEEITPIKTEIMPNVELQETKMKKGSLTLPIKKKKTKEAKLKTNKKSNIFAFFRHNERKSPIPALDLPSVERDLSPNNPLRLPHRHDSDPLHVPSIDLPKLDLPLPTYDRPEVNMTTGKTKQSSEFSIPVIDFPPIPNLQLPENNKQSTETNSDLMKIPNVQLPNLQFTLNNQENIKFPQIEAKTKTKEVSVQPTIETGLALSSPVDDLLGIQIDRKNFPVETDYAIKTEPFISSLTTHMTEISSQTTDQQITIIDTHLVQSSEVPSIIEKQIMPDFAFQLPSPEPVLTLPKDSRSPPPSFDDDVPSPPSKIVPAIKPLEKQQQPIETKTEQKKKSSTLALCSCFGNKSTTPKDKTQTIAAPKSSLPEIKMPLPSSNISSTLQTKGSLRAPSNDLPAVNLTPTSTETVHLPAIHTPEKKEHTEAVVPSVEMKKEEIPTQSPTPPVLEKAQIKSDISRTDIEKQPVEQIKSKKSSSFEIKAPIMNVPQVDLSGPPKSEAYLSFSKQEETTSVPEQIQSRSDSGLEAVISSHVHPSSTFGTHTTIGDIQQHPSVSSGFGSEIFDNMTTKGYSLPDIQLPEPTLVPKPETHSTKPDVTQKISINDETRAKLIFRQNELKNCLESEISKSIYDFDAKKDHKSLDKILTHAIDLIKDQKVTTYPELKQKLTIEHKNEAFIVDPVVHSLYYTIEKHGLDNLDKPEFPLAIRDMVRLPAKQTYDTVRHLNKESASLTTTEMTKETLPDTARSCLTCGRSKSKTKLPSPTTTTTISSTGVLDERRRLQLTTHRNELGNILRDHIQSSQPPIRKFADHPKEIDKILRKSLTLLNQPKIVSYEQIRNDLKNEYKQTYYLIDPIVDITRDTFDHCDITQMNEKTNLDILDSNISQTANLYNNQKNLLTSEEHHALKSNQLSWLQSYLITNESKDKKLTRKQRKELNKILQRTLEILSTNLISTWDELTLQLQREYPKAHDLCNRSIELIQQSQRDGLFHLQQAPVQDKRRASSLITDRARQNLKTNRNKIILSLKTFLTNYNKSSNDEQQLESYLNKTFDYLEEQKAGQFKSYNDLKEQLKKDFKKSNQEKLIEQIVDVIEQAHATNQFDDIDKPEVQTLMKDRLDGKPLILKEMYVSLPPRVGAYGDDSLRYSSTSNGDGTTTSHRVARGLSWREANERARILFYRGKHPAIHYDEQAAAFDVRMLLETASGGTQEIPVTDSDVQELLNSCGVQWDGVNIVSLVDHSEDVVRAAEQAALKVIREKGMVDLRTPASSTNNDETND